MRCPPVQVRVRPKVACGDEVGGHPADVAPRVVGKAVLIHEASEDFAL